MIDWPMLNFGPINLWNAPKINYYEEQVRGRKLKPAPRRPVTINPSEVKHYHDQRGRN